LVILMSSKSRCHPEERSDEGSQKRDSSSSFGLLRMTAVVLIFSAAGCGYTTKSRLPENIKSIYVQPVKNTIDLSMEINPKGHFNAYRPGIEVDLTNAIINRFIFDGNLKVTSPEKANAIVDTKFIEYRREPLRYTDGDDVQEYRLSIVLDVAVFESTHHKVLWHETVTGDTTYFISGSRALSEDEALVKVVDDTARRVVEKTIELW